MPRISKRIVDAAPTGPKDRFIWDAELKGFGLKVTPKGRKVYILKYRMKGGRAVPTKRYTIGTHGNPWTPDTARTEAERLRGMIADHVDPGAARATTDAEPQGGEGPATIADLVEEYLERWARPKKRSAPEDQRTLYKEVIPIWGSRGIAKITRRDIVTLLDGIVDRGSPIQANRTLATVRRMFNFAIERGIIEVSPCVRVRAPGKERARDRNLSAGEIVRFWGAIDSPTIEPAMRLGLRFLLATGQRKSEVFGLHDREVDVGEGTWLIPATRSKNGREHLVPLSPVALEIIAEARTSRDKEAGEGESSDVDKPVPVGWLFPSARTRGPYHPQTPDHVMRDLFLARIKNKKRPSVKPPPAPRFAHMEPFTPHDLRRTAATKMRELGITRDDVSLVLNHKVGGVTAAHYDRYEGLREKRRALDIWANYLGNLLRPMPPNVMPLSAARVAAAN